MISGQRAVFWCAVVGILCSLATGAAEKGKGRKAKGKRPRRPNPALQQIEDVKGLPRVLLIGDSISMGYTIPTRGLLDGKANVHRIPTNGGDTNRGINSIEKWLGEKKWDVIHFNWGLHDLKRMDGKTHGVSLEQYAKNLGQLVARLKKTGAKLIWASTTPVPEGELKPARSDADVVAYNAAAGAVMGANGVAIDDLYAFALPILGEIQRPVNVHFFPDGSKKLAGKVASMIEGALAE
ncbi:MAG: SGNH/GDSL hydrolase family protein [Lentisphaerae bacterium]|nr:SGNH/GDSL hydrolase family protein [Lentisphaerota bacterium]MBT5610572.1 SGNH/GDSL hydrolase family protein [Lentisphaerota bacterium]MBT7060166.1 SGNH/GDSL hydrolase family protein [Lentisphaerota bacterium]MBT7844131.1 SGNH/GDSL hydrolase family protein [Lentisphaerota bacterium]